MVLGVSIFKHNRVAELEITSSKYSRTSVARTLMARFPRMFQTHS